MRGPIVGHEARNVDARKVFLNTFENIINRRVDIPEDIRRFERTLEYARSKVDYVIGEFIYVLPSDMNLWIGKIKNYNKKILISSSNLKIGTNLNTNLDDTKHIEKDNPDAKSKKEKVIKTKPEKPDMKSRKEDNRDIKMIKF